MISEIISPIVTWRTLQLINQRSLIHSKLHTIAISLNIEVKLDNTGHTFGVGQIKGKSDKKRSLNTNWERDREARVYIQLLREKFGMLQEQSEPALSNTIGKSAWDLNKT